MQHHKNIVAVFRCHRSTNDLPQNPVDLHYETSRGLRSYCIMIPQISTQAKAMEMHRESAKT